MERPAGAPRRFVAIAGSICLGAVVGGLSVLVALETGLRDTLLLPLADRSEVEALREDVGALEGQIEALKSQAAEVGALRASHQALETEVRAFRSQTPSALTEQEVIGVVAAREIDLCMRLPTASQGNTCLTRLRNLVGPQTARHLGEGRWLVSLGPLNRLFDEKSGRVVE